MYNRGICLRYQNARKMMILRRSRCSSLEQIFPWKLSLRVEPTSEELASELLQIILSIKGRFLRDNESVRLSPNKQQNQREIFSLGQKQL